MTKKSYDGSGLRDSDGGVLLNATVIRNTIRQQALTIGLLAVPLPTVSLSKRLSLLICNNSTGGQVVYLGDSSVTSVNGFPLYPRAVLSVQLEDEATIYAISSAVGADVRIVEGS